MNRLDLWYFMPLLTSLSLTTCCGDGTSPEGEERSQGMACCVTVSSARYIVVFNGSSCCASEMHLGIFGVFCVSATQSYCVQRSRGKSCSYAVNCCIKCLFKAFEAEFLGPIYALYWSGARDLFPLKAVVATAGAMTTVYTLKHN